MLITQSFANPAQIRNAIIDSIHSDTEEVKIAAAYVTKSGSDIVLNSLKDKIGEHNFNRINKTLITSFDYGITDPDALQQWMGLPNSNLLIAGKERLEKGSLTPFRAFHPKIYSFRYGNGNYTSLFGSANLTSRGFSVNTEAGWLQSNIPNDEIELAFSTIACETCVITQDLLDKYRALRIRIPTPPEIQIEAEPVPEPEMPEENEIQTFGDALESNRIDLNEYEAMWIQGEALQGGSRNQLELPRGSHRFFGFNFNDYQLTDKVTIGSPTLWTGPDTWTDRLLTWHGNNKMERFNLPTQRQGGFDYANTAVMFRKTGGNTFELIVANWNSDIARSWRQASHNRNTLFRLGRRATNRLVGLL